MNSEQALMSMYREQEIAIERATEAYNSVQGLYRLLIDVFSIIPRTVLWREFARSVRHAVSSGRSNRFVQDNEPGFVLDRKTGQAWPVSIFRAISRMDDAE